MKKYSLGVFLNLFTDNTLDWHKQIQDIQSLGNVEHIEILLEYIPKTQRERKQLASWLKQYRVILHAPFMDLSLLSPHHEVVQLTEKILQEAIDFGNELSAEMMTIHAERYPNFWTPETAKKHVLQSLNYLLNYSSFPLAIENLSFSGNTQLAYPQTPQQITELAQALPKNAGLVIDTGHLLKDGNDVYETIKQVKNSVLNFHVHDGYEGAAHLQLGKGELNTKKILSMLDTIDYQNFVTLEVIGTQPIYESWKLLQTLTQI